MSGDIKVGAKFGSYEATVKDLNTKYSRKHESTKEGEQIEFFDYKSGAKKAEANRTTMQDLTKATFENKKFTGGHVATSTLTMGSFHYSAENTKPDATGTVPYPNKFTKVETATQYAIDKNNNGVVDKEEIFDKNY